MDLKPNSIAVDIGNSRLKVLINEKVNFIEYNDSWQTNLYYILEKNSNTSIIAYSSINSIIEIDFLKIINNFKNYTVIKPKELLNKQNLVKFHQIQGIGSDRVFGLIGAVIYSEPPLITIDCGTAITINVLDSKSICIGGAIFPGIYTQIKALHQNTDGLKNLYLNL